ncbi:hypothetical protein AB0P17_42975 [Streptomyces sp. NPDC088124]|uniref:hypothetical protein n=1 Tax=Streptomyces sp. NPDC088124 TaxID=3154654 RepID=UPI0034456058
MPRAEASRFAEENLLDPAAAISALDGATRGEPAPLAVLHTLIGTELWLTTLLTARHIWWQKTPGHQTYSSESGILFR